MHPLSGYESLVYEDWSRHLRDDNRCICLIGYRERTFNDGASACTKYLVETLQATVRNKTLA
jgi:hypothetical protein